MCVAVVWLHGLKEHSLFLTTTVVMSNPETDVFYHYHNIYYICRTLSLVYS